MQFIDLQAQQKRIWPQVDVAVKRVLDHGKYIMGPEVAELERNLGAFCGAKHAISCSSGTDALLLILMAKGIGPGDAIFVPSFTFAATAEVVSFLGAHPVFVDVLPDTFNMDPESLKIGIQKAKEAELRSKAIIAVDLFGQPADYDAIEPVAQEHGLWVLGDAAQSCGATYKGRKVGTLGLATATSFFPAKPLGCYGDGGCIFTDDEDLAEVIRSLRVHGKGSDKYDNVRIGINGRLDTIQAAILLEKLKIFPEELKVRQQAADFYTESLKGIVQTPSLLENTTSAWAQYTFVLKEDMDRDHLQASLKDAGVPSVVYYVKPLDQQKAYKGYLKAGDLKVSDQLSKRVLSLPMHPYLEKEDQEKIVETFRQYKG